MFVDYTAMLYILSK